MLRLIFLAYFLASDHVSFTTGQITILNGGGAAFALPVYEKWWILWSTREPVTVIYKGIGSYFGKRWIRGEPLQNHEIGEKIVFAGTDFPLTEQDYKDFPTLQMIPVIAGDYGTHKLDEQFVKHEVSEFSMEWNPNVELSSACGCALSAQPHALDSSTFGFHSIENSDTSCFTNGSSNLALMLAFNIPGINSLRVTRDTVTGIYNGDIQYWSDERLQAINPHAMLPNQLIRVLARRDDAGVTQTLTKAFAAFSEDWANGPGVFMGPELLKPEGPSANWPVNGTEYYPYTDVGMSSMILSIPYSIGYVSVAESIEWGLKVASVENKHGETITPDMVEQGVNIAMEYNKRDLGERMVADLIDTPEHKAYPLATFTYLLVNMTTTPGITCTQMKYFVKMALFALEDPEAKKIAHDMSMVPLIPELVRLIKERVVYKITCHGVRVIDLIAEDERPKGLTMMQLVLVIVAAIVGSIIIIIFGWQYNIRLNVGAKKWLIDENEVTMGSNMPTLGSHGSASTKTSREGTQSKVTYNSSQASSLHSVASASKEDTKPFIWSFYGLRAGFCRGDPILLFECRSKKPPYNYRYDTCKKILYVHKMLSHDNVLPVMGLMRDNEGKLFHMYRSNAKSSLHHILSACPYELNEEIKFTLASDICKAMAYLHKNGVKHGILDTWNCLMDSNWSLRLADWTQVAIAECEGDTDVLTLTPSDYLKIQSVTEMKRSLFRHPDFFSGMIGQGKDVQRYHDLYSYALVLIEVFTRKPPYTDKAEEMGGWEKLFKDLCKNHRLPTIRSDVPQHIKNLIDQLAKNLLQINFEAVLVVLEMSRTSKKGTGIVDTLMKAMEEYMGRLEEKVAERTEEMKGVMLRMDELLKSILPPEVAQKLQNGETVEPKFYESVTVYFSDIVQFTKLSSNSTPLEVVNFLNALYTMFDKIVEKYDVYKVETIGDAYMCVSGLPRTNGDKHAAEIVRLSLTLLKGVQTFRIPHRPKQQLKIRIGVNSGSVMAGVVGLKMPRYCLFGDAVNVASRMESSGMANKIQAAETTVKILDEEFGGEFLTELRGETEIKGKGMMKSYWILDGTDVVSVPSTMSTPAPFDTVDAPGGGDVAVTPMPPIIRQSDIQPDRTGSLEANEFSKL